jgi:hypothetical protein
MTRIDRCVVDDWPRQGVFFQDTILSEMSLTAVGGCGSLTGGVNGGTGYAAVEVDSANVDGNAGGSGSTTWSWWNNNISGNTGTGLRIDRTGPTLVHGGTSEGANMPYCIEIASKTETVSGVSACTIEALDLEVVSPSAGGAVAFVGIGYGLNGVNNSNAQSISISHCTLVTDTGFMPYGVKAKYTAGLYMQGNIVQIGASAETSSTANIWFEGTTCSAMVIAADNVFDNSVLIPIVMVNGAQDYSAKLGQHWSYSPAAFGGGTYGSSWNVPKVSTPATPTSGFTFYVDSADSKFKAVGSSGTVNIIDATALTP